MTAQFNFDKRATRLNCLYALIIALKYMSHVQFTQFTRDPVHFGTWLEETATKVAKDERRRFNGLVICTY